MAHIYYEEEQRFSNVAWIWIAVILLFLSVPLLTLVSDSVSQKDMTSISLSMTVSFLPVVAMLLFGKLLVKIDGDGVHYQFIPVIRKWRTVPKSHIESFEVTEKRSLWEKLECGYGYRRDRFRRTISMNICGEKFARIKLLDGQKLKIGTKDPDSMERALRKLTSPEND